MTSIRRRLTVPEVTELLDQGAVNGLITSATVNGNLSSATVNGLITSATVNGKLSAAAVESKLPDKIKVGTVTIPDNNQVAVNVGAQIKGAAVCFNGLGNIHTACGCTWSGNVLTIRNSSGSSQSIAYIAITS